VTQGEEGKGKRERFVPIRLTFLFSLFSYSGLCACTSITIRPNIRPFPLAAVDTVRGNPTVVLEAARDAVVQLGMQLSRSSPQEGYLETRWFDVASHQSYGENFRPQRLVRTRVWTDLVTPIETQVVVETVLRSTIDPSVPGREVELVTAPGTPGDSLTQAVRTALKKRFARDSITPAPAPTPGPPTAPIPR
jgi:hypothetical protein